MISINIHTGWYDFIAKPLSIVLVCNSLGRANTRTGRGILTDLFLARIWKYRLSVFIGPIRVIRVPFFTAG
jgi:hypothetical protein